MAGVVLQATVTGNSAEGFELIVAGGVAAYSAGVPEAVSSLSDRELEVLRLLARGLSNAEIAGRLHLGDTTVKSHVARILAKLDLRDRVQTVVFAYETAVVRPGGDD